MRGLHAAVGTCQVQEDGSHAGAAGGRWRHPQPAAPHLHMAQSFSDCYPTPVQSEVIF